MLIPSLNMSALQNEKFQKSKKRSKTTKKLHKAFSQPKLKIKKSKLGGKMPYHLRKSWEKEIEFKSNTYLVTMFSMTFPKKEKKRVIWI